MLKNKKANMYSNYFKEDFENLALTKYCEWHKCDEKGEYKAPTSREKLREFKWFCLKHVKMYNKGWDYFKGKTADDIYEEISKDARWHRPTWQRVKNVKTDDYFTFFKDRIPKGKSTKNHNKTFNNEINNALEIFDTSMPKNIKDLKSKYKKLVKKFHPDITKQEDEEFIIKLNNAYSTLKKYF